MKIIITLLLLIIVKNDLLGTTSIFSDDEMFKFVNEYETNETSYDLKSIAQLSSQISDDGNIILAKDKLSISNIKYKYMKEINLKKGSPEKVEIDDYGFRINKAYQTNSPNSIKSQKERIMFVFQLSSKFFYYTVSDTDLNILETIAIDLIEEVLDDTYKINPFIVEKEKCFALIMKENDKYAICAPTISIRDKFMCLIDKLINKNQPKLTNCNLDLLNTKLDIESKNSEKYKLVNKTQQILLIPLPSEKCNENWNYYQKGSDWQCICKEGKEQSPIDLPTSDMAIKSAIKPIFEYEVISSINSFDTIDGIQTKDTKIQFKYLLNALRIFHPNMGKITTLDGSVYIAEEIVFHTPSEHKINGEQFDMEMQIIHYGRTKGDISKQVILSFLFKKKPGWGNKFIEKIDFFNLPNKAEDSKDIEHNLYIPDIFYSSLDDKDIPLLKPFSFYTYSGSITFPPCTERTIVYVASDVINLSTTAIEMFKEALRMPDLMDDDLNFVIDNSPLANNRNTQELNGRPIFFYDHIKYCGPNYISKTKRNFDIGHYEKRTKEVTNYFYVDNNKPSGLPGALLVPEKEAKGINNS